MIAAIALTVSCKKNSDEGVGPEVNWTAPTELSTVFSVDTFLVEAAISDPDGVKRVSVDFTDAEGNSLASIPDVFPNEQDYSYSEVFLLNRPDLTGGAHYLQLEAYDEFNRTSVFREINLNPIPWENKATALVTGSDLNGMVSISEEDGLDFSGVLNYSGDIQNLQANHLDGLILVVTGQSGEIIALQHPEYNTAWTYEIPNNNDWRSIESASLLASIGEVAVANTDHQVQLINKFGNSVLAFDTGLDLYVPDHCLLSESRVYLVERRPDGTDQQFSVFFKISGALEFRVYFPGEVVDLFTEKSDAVSEDLVTVFLNDDGIPRLKTLDYFGQGFDEPVSLPAGELTSACKIGYERYLFQINGTIYHYDFSGPLEIYYEGPDFKELVYDPVNQQVLALTEDEIHYLAMQNGILQLANTQPAANVISIVRLRNR